VDSVGFAPADSGKQVLEVEGLLAVPNGLRVKARRIAVYGVFRLRSSMIGSKRSARPRPSFVRSCRMPTRLAKTAGQIGRCDRCGVLTYPLLCRNRSPSA